MRFENINLENKQVVGKAPSMYVYIRKIGDLITDAAKLGTILIADLIDCGQTFFRQTHGSSATRGSATLFRSLGHNGRVFKII